MMPTYTAIQQTDDNETVVLGASPVLDELVARIKKAVIQEALEAAVAPEQFDKVQALLFGGTPTPAAVHAVMGSAFLPELYAVVQATWAQISFEEIEP